MNDEFWGINETENRHLGNHVLQVIAHRGFSSIAPENTIPAYTLAKAKGFKYVECDVSWTKDGIPVLIHDAAVDRTSDGAGNVSELTLSQLKSCDFGSWKAPEYAGTRIPTFEEFIMCCSRLQLHPYIEIKRTITSSQASVLADLVSMSGMAGNITWISFSTKSLGKILELLPAARVGYVCKKISESKIRSALSLRNASNHVFIDCDYTTLTPALANSALKQGLPVEAWTVNTDIDAGRLARLGVRGVTTDTLLFGP